MDIYNLITSYPSLLYGFYRVKESDGAAGVDRVTIEMFEEDLQRNISKLYYELSSNKYYPLPLLTFERRTSHSKNNKTEGKIRLLTISAVRDRVAQASALNILEPIIDSELENESFAYRKGYSREAAARRINNLFNRGYCWLLDADIRKFFDNVDHKILFDRLSSVLNDERTITLIKKWIQAEYIYKNKKKKQTIGLPQGSVIAPILANLYLDKFDEAIKKKGYHLVRFADDFIILTRNKSDALNTLKLTQDLLAEIKLELNIEKTSITNFSEGFRYLGYLFLNSLIVPASKKDTSKPIPFQQDEESSIEIERFKAITAKRNEEASFKKKLQQSDLGSKILNAIESKGMEISDFISSIRQCKGRISTEPEITVEAELTAVPQQADNLSKENKSFLNGKEIPLSNKAISFKRTLYIQTQGSVLRKEGERLIVEKNGEVLIDIPSLRINQIIIFGTCSITPASMQFCLMNNIPVTLLSSFGKYFGKLESTKGKSIELERLQYFTSVDKQLMLSLSKAVITGKIGNTRTLLQRTSKRRKSKEVSEAIDLMKNDLARVEKTDSIEKLRGIEGSNSAVYFGVFGRIFKTETGFFNAGFKRNRRPPKDPINSLLSFGYTLLSANIYSTLTAMGLNPYVGFYHVLKPGHPALASDMIEEFRHIIDSLVIQVINKGILTKKAFYFVKEPDMPCLLTNEGRKEFIRQFEIKMHRTTTHSPTGKKADYRRCIMLQAAQFAKVLKGEKPYYEPFRIKL